MRALTALSVAGAVPGALGGLVFWAAHGGTTVTRAIAYGLWFAAAVELVLMVLAGRRFVWRRTNLPVPESWVFLGASVVLTLAGAGVDAAGA